MGNDPSAADNDSDPFYVGYLPTPRAYRRMVLLVVLVLGMGLAGSALVIATQQRDPGPGVWDTGHAVELEGLLIVDPYPMLLIREEGEPSGIRTVLLVEQYKRGAQERASAWRGKAVLASGFAIERDGRFMIELLESEDAIVASDIDTSRLRDAHRATHGVEATLSGEIIDPKCFLGVMKPGEGKIHKACAIRCIDGGIPPVLVTHDAAGSPAFYLVTDRAGHACNDAVLPFVADPVTISGRVELHGDLFWLRADTDSIRRH